MKVDKLCVAKTQSGSQSIDLSEVIRAHGGVTVIAVLHLYFQRDEETFQSKLNRMHPAEFIPSI